MSRTLHVLLPWLAPIVLVWACCLPAASAQGQQPAPGAAQPDPGQGAKGAPSGGLYIFEHILALVGVGVTLFIVCVPSRKRF
ncbi:MAG: hypothetical protein L0Z62_23360 [Gemmataceae bacterium]|nr:hypothetical protein [Gemmataceae bacterium]